MSYLTRHAGAVTCLALTIAWFTPSTNFAAAESNLSAAFAIPLPPTYVAPANGATGLGQIVQLKYNPAAGATRYNIQVATDAQFKTIVWSLNLPGTFVNMIAPYMGKTYYWRVNAWSPDGTSNWGPVWTFTTQAPVTSPPTLIYPKNGAEGVHMTVGLEFSSVPNATRYNVQVASDPSFTKNVIEFAVNAMKSPVTFTALTAGTHFWRVQAAGPFSSSKWTDPWSFSNLWSGPIPILPPVLLLPVNGAVGQPLTVHLHWEAADGAIRYNVQVATDAAFSNIIWAQNVPTNVVTLTVPASTKCYWRVQTAGASSSSAFSSPWNFTTAGAQAANLSALKKRDADETIPASYALHENYPNPFNPSTTIVFDLPEATNVKLAVYDLLGHEVMEIVSGDVEAGRHSYNIDASSWASGMYLYRLETAGFTQTRRMLLLK